MEKFEWLKWRKLGIGGSDAPIIMNLSKFKTPLQLYEEKITSEIPEQKPNFVADRGNRMEGPIRNLFNLIMGTEFEPVLLQSETDSWLRVSLDGQDGSMICEIKTVGKANHELARANTVPPEYVPQIQHELLVSGAEFCYYISYHDPEWKENEIESSNLAFFKVFADLEYMEELYKSEKAFWERVQKRKPPEPSDRDFMEVNGEESLVDSYLTLKIDIAFKQKELDLLEDQIKEIANQTNHPRIRMGDLKLTRVTRAGTVDYSKIPQLKEVDLDLFRKPSSTHWRLS